MRKFYAEVTVLDPEDLRRSARDKDISEISQMDVSYAFEIVEEAEILLYINEKGQGKVLKNIY